MSVASHKGLVAAAGPNAVIIATTESVRKAFKDPAPRDGNFKSFQPQLTLPMQMRVSQLAFSADELYLVLAAEVGGGLAVYEVQALLQGSTQSAFELSTNGQALRALVPNPTAERAELFAIVTADGNFMMANLKEKAIVPGPSGQILKEGVSCLSWTTKGKQLVAGFGNGTACQMTPDGLSKVDIPKPPGIDDNHHGMCSASPRSSN
jgi:nucleoporin NUP159